MSDEEEYPPDPIPLFVYEMNCNKTVSTQIDCARCVWKQLTAIEPFGTWVRLTSYNLETQQEIVWYDKNKSNSSLEVRYAIALSMLNPDKNIWRLYVQRS